VVSVTTVTDRSAQQARARTAWTALPHGGRDAVILQVQCAQGHHLAKVLATDIGPIVVTTVRAHSHGDRDLPDAPHSPGRAPFFVDLRDVPGADDAIPAWCDCGHRVLSRAVLRAWSATGESRVIVD
jgi:hypothetical protein